MKELSTLQNLIYEIRDRQVMLDSDLAQIYQVETKALNQAVKRNIGRFPSEFMFQLTAEEYESLRCQIGILNNPTFLSENGTVVSSIFGKFINRSIKWGW